MDAWKIYQSAILVVAAILLYAAFRPRFEPALFITAVAVFACAFIHRPHPE